MPYYRIIINSVIISEHFFMKIKSKYLSVDEYTLIMLGESTSLSVCHDSESRGQVRLTIAGCGVEMKG
jgi:hypothetical protein